MATPDHETPANEVPELAGAAMRRFTEQLAELRTVRTRFGELPEPEVDVPAPEPLTTGNADTVDDADADALGDILRPARSQHAGR